MITKKKKLLIVIAALIVFTINFDHIKVFYKWNIRNPIIKQIRQAREDKILSFCKGLKGKELKECKYPSPDIGSWKALYTEELAKEYNLPPENIKADMPDNVAYMEMMVPNYTARNYNARRCIFNTLVKKPNDISFVNMGTDEDKETWIKMNAERKLLKLIDIDSKKDRMKISTSSSVASSNYSIEKGTIFPSVAYYIGDVLPNYDYLTVMVGCDSLSRRYSKYFPDKLSLWVAKASVWGKYKSNYSSYSDYNIPVASKYYKSYFHINIPQEIVSEVFKGVRIDESEDREERLRELLPNRCRGKMWRDSREYTICKDSKKVIGGYYNDR